MSVQLFYFEEFGKAFVPKRFRPHLREYFLKAGIMDVPYKIFGAMFYVALFATFLVYFVRVYPLFLESNDLVRLFIFTILTWVIVPLLGFGFLALATYFYLDLRVYNRTRTMENVLPDFLRFVAENLKGGMPFERALWGSIRPEFGVLAHEVRLAAKRVMTGDEVGDALRSFTGKYKSPTLRRSFDLIIEALRSGGEVAYIIDRVVEDLEETKQLKDEMQTTNLSYIIFVSLIVLVIAPGIFTLSFQFLMVLIKLGAQVGGATASSTLDFPIKIGADSIDPDFFRRFSQYALGILSVGAAMIISQINRGDIKGGLKYIPIFLIVTQSLYFVFMHFATIFFEGFISIG